MVASPDSELRVGGRIDRPRRAAGAAVALDWSSTSTRWDRHPQVRFGLKTSVGRQMALALGSLLVVLLVTDLFSFQATRRLVVARKQADRAREVVDELERLHHLIVEAEAGQRTFLIAGDEGELEAFQVARRTLPDVLARLRDLKVDDREGLAEIERLETTTRTRLDRLEHTVSVVRQRGFAAAAAEIRAGDSPEIMRQLKQLVGTMERREDEMLKRRLREAERHGRTAVVSSQIAGLGGLVLATLLAFVLTRSITVPIASLIAGLRRIGDGDLDHRIELGRQDEFGTLGAAVGDMAARRKRAEEELRRAETRLETLLETLPVGVVIADENGRISHSNPAAQRIWGRTPHVELERYTDYQGFWPDGQRLRSDEWALARAFTHGETAIGEVVRIVDFDGVAKTIMNNGAPLRDAEGRIFGAVVAFEDISKLVKMEEDQRLLAEVTAAFVASLDWEATLRHITELAVPRLADWCSVDLVDGEEIRSFSISRAQTTSLAAMAEAWRRYPVDTIADHPVARAIRNGEAIVAPRFADLIGTFARDPAHRRLVEDFGLDSCIVVPLRVHDRILGAVTFITAGSGRSFAADDLPLMQELARRAALAVENARLYREAQQATRLREEMLALVSHDLKNPLWVVLLNCKLLEGMLSGAMTPVREKLSAIERATRRADRMVNDLVDLAALRAGRLRIERRAESPSRLVEEVVTGLRPLAAEKSQSLTGRVASDLPAMSYDHDRMLQVLSNVVGNAIKATAREGTIEVQVERRGEEAVFSVRDTGPGIPARDLPHVFDQFWRAHDAGYKGTGLGLAICRGLVNAHGGRIWVESRIGTGSTFFFSLPVASPRELTYRSQ